MQLKFVGAITNIIVMKICAYKKSYLYFPAKYICFVLLIIIFLNKQMQVKAFDRIFAIQLTPTVLSYLVWLYETI